MLQISYSINTVSRTVICPVERCYNLHSTNPEESIFVFRSHGSATPIALIRCATLDAAWCDLATSGALADRLLSADQWEETNILHKFICGHWYDLSRDHAWIQSCDPVRRCELLVGDPINPTDRIDLARCHNTDDGKYIYLMASEFGYGVAVGADELGTALDEAADHGLLKRWKIDDPTEADYAHHASLGGAGDVFDLSYFAYTPIPRR